jgi:hypothetical protein
VSAGVKYVDALGSKTGEKEMELSSKLVWETRLLKHIVPNVSRSRELNDVIKSIKAGLD